MTKARPPREQKWFTSTVGTLGGQRSFQTLLYIHTHTRGVIRQSLALHVDIDMCSCLTRHNHSWSSRPEESNTRGKALHSVEITLASGILSNEWREIQFAAPKCCRGTHSQQPQQWASERGHGGQVAALWRRFTSPSAQVKLNKSLLINALRSGDEAAVLSRACRLKIRRVWGGGEEERCRPCF